MDRGVPTWSWASVNGVVSHAWEEQEDGLEIAFSVKSASVDLLTEDATGRTSSGKLVLLALITHGHSLEDLPSDGNIMASLSIESSGSVVTFYPDRPGELDKDESYSCLAATIASDGDIGWFMVLRDVGEFYERVGLGVTSPMLGIGEDMWDDAEDETITIV